MGLVQSTLTLKDGDVTYHSYQDVEPIIELNKAQANDKPAVKSDLQLFARVPNNILVMWLHEEHARGNTKLKLFDQEMTDIVQKKLEDPDWRYLRV